MRYNKELLIYLEYKNDFKLIYSKTNLFNVKNNIIKRQKLQ